MVAAKYTKPTLLVLAAGMGSRYGGLKQMDPVGPGGETIIDYSVYDAIRSGFGKIVFVIRRDIEEAFKESVGKKYEEKINVEYAFQELDYLPQGFSVPVERKKPWGTGHAILVAENVINEPFAVINADDFYGTSGFQLLSECLQKETDSAHYCMAGFVLRNTLSEFGSVSRGVCQCSRDSHLLGVVERTKIEKDGQRAIYTDDEGNPAYFSGDEIVSMNMWGFAPSLFARLKEDFANFLKKRAGELKSEFFIPSVVNELVAEGKVKVKVLKSTDSWFGITYPDDKPRVVESIRQLVEQGAYPAKLWE